MRNDKALSSRKIRMLLVEKTIFLTCFGAIVAHLRQISSVSQFVDRIGAVPRSRSGWLYTVSRSRHASKLDGIMVRHISPKAIICIIVCGPSRYIHVQISSVGSCFCGKRHGFSFFKGTNRHTGFCSLSQHITKRQPAFFVQSILFLCFFDGGIQFAFVCPFRFCLKFFGVHRFIFRSLGQIFGLSAFFRFRHCFCHALCLRGILPVIGRRVLRLAGISWSRFRLLALCSWGRFGYDQVTADLISGMLRLLRFYIIHRMIGIGMVRGEILSLVILRFLKGNLYLFIVQDFNSAVITADIKRTASLNFIIFGRYNFIRIQLFPYFLQKRRLCLRFCRRHRHRGHHTGQHCDCHQKSGNDPF